jgi:hypothetical protein
MKVAAFATPSTVAPSTGLAAAAGQSATSRRAFVGAVASTAATAGWSLNTSQAHSAGCQCGNCGPHANGCCCPSCTTGHSLACSCANCMATNSPFDSVL